MVASSPQRRKTELTGKKGRLVESQQDHLERLSKLVARLRGPGGCPWDREQTLADVRAYLLEEAHEVAGAIDEQDPVEDQGFPRRGEA